MLEVRSWHSVVLFWGVVIECVVENKMKDTSQAAGQDLGTGVKMGDLSCTLLFLSGADRAGTKTSIGGQLLHWLGSWKFGNEQSNPSLEEDL